MALLLGYSWPGNVRELHNLIERASLLAGTSSIEVADLPEEMRHKRATAPAAGTLEQARELFEREYLEALMQECQGNVSHAAVHAGMHRTSLQRLLSKHDLRSDGFRPI